jgi:hypothetical protein
MLLLLESSGEHKRGLLVHGEKNATRAGKEGAIYFNLGRVDEDQFFNRLGPEPAHPPGTVKLRTAKRGLLQRLLV